MGIKYTKLIGISLALSLNLYAQDSFTLKQQSLEDAIKQIAFESKMPYVADGKLLKGKTSNEITNVEGIQNALNELLEGTNLKAVIKNNAILIVKKEKILSKAKKSKITQENELENNLGEVEIVAASRSNLELEKIPASIKIISKEEIEEQLSITSNSSEVLGNLISSYTPSRQKLSGNNETIRGRTPLILIDGIPQSNPLRPTGREVHTIDFQMVESIEVINGASSTNGISGVGGVINIITKKPDENKITQTLDIQTVLPTSKIKSDTASYKLGYSIGGQEDKFDYFVSGSYEDQGLYVDGNGDAVGLDAVQGDIMNSKSYDVLARVGYWIDDEQSVDFLINKYNIKSKHDYKAVDGDKDNKVLTTSVKGTPQGDAPFNDALTTKLSYENEDFMGMKLSAMLFNQRFEGLFGATNSKSFQDVNIAPDGTLYDQSRVKSTKSGTKLTLNKNGLLDNKLNLTFGFDTMFDETFQDLYLTNRTYVPKSQYNVYSPFVLAAYNLTDNLTLHTGVRHEKGNIEVESYTTVPRYNSVFVEGGEIDIAETLFNAGLIYDFQNNTNIFASYSEGFTLPDIGRALRSINTSGVSLSSFKNLDPIITDNYEIGLRTKQGMIDFEASIYQSESKFGSRLATDNLGQYVLKREETQIRGLDLGLGLKVNKANKLNFLYSYSQGKYDSDEDGTLDAKLGAANMAPNRFIGKWSSRINNELSTYLQVNHNFDRAFDDEEDKFNGYTLVDLSSSYKLSKGTLSLGIANVFDKQYVTYYSQSATNIDSRYSAGRGRTVTLGYSLKF